VNVVVVVEVVLVKIMSFIEAKRTDSGTHKAAGRERTRRY
jgi:hypothetical protein